LLPAWQSRGLALPRNRTVTRSDHTLGTAGHHDIHPIERSPTSREGGNTTVDIEEAGGRHRRRRANRATRTALDEARRAGLVRRHLTKLRYLTERAARAPTPEASGPAAEGPASTSDAA
jgi:hypothetical protein